MDLENFNFFYHIELKYFHKIIKLNKFQSNNILNLKNNLLKFIKIVVQLILINLIKNKKQNYRIKYQL